MGTTLKALKIIKYCLALLFIVFLIYFVPRYLIFTFGQKYYLNSLIYIYSFGTLVFVFNIFWLIKSGALNLNHPGEKKWLAIFSFCLLWWMFVHSLWTGFAKIYPFSGN